MISMSLHEIKERLGPSAPTEALDDLLDLFLLGLEAAGQHFHGEGVKLVHEKSEKTFKLILKKADVVLYRGEGPSPVYAGGDIIRNIIEIEQVQKAGNNHPECRLCTYLFNQLERTLGMINSASSFLMKEVIKQEVKGLFAQIGGGELTGLGQLIGASVEGTEGMEIDDLDKVFQARAQFSQKYAEEKGWGGIHQLSIEQVMEIREQDGWKNPL